MSLLYYSVVALIAVALFLLAGVVIVKLGIREYFRARKSHLVDLLGSGKTDSDSEDQ